MSTYAQKGNRDVWGSTIVLAQKRGLWKRLRGQEKGLRENQAAVLVQRRFRLKIKARIAARKVEERKKEIERLEHEARIRTREPVASSTHTVDTNDFSHHGDREC